MDIKLNYIDKGTGEPLILLHGNGEYLEYFEHQIEYFSKEYRVIALDTRGHGKSPRGEAPFTIRQFADDLKDFMDELGIEKAHVLGFSDGGNIAMIFAMKYPERVNKVILNGANLFASGVKLGCQISITYEYYQALFFAKKYPKAKKKAELYGLMVKDPNVKPKELKQLKARTLVLAGEEDLIKKSHSKLIYKNLPDAELAIIPGDHWIAKKNPETFNKTVEKFLRG